MIFKTKRFSYAQKNFICHHQSNNCFQTINIMNPNKRSSEDEIGLETQSSKKLRSAPSIDKIINNPGLQHITEEIFINLDFNDIIACQLINKSCKVILNNPMFWLKKWRLRGGLSKKNETVWIKAIQKTRNTNMAQNVDLYFKKIIKLKNHIMDVQCYIDSIVIENFSDIMEDINNDIADVIRIGQYSDEKSLEDAVEQIIFWKYENAFKLKNAGFLQLLVPLMKNLKSLTHIWDPKFGERSAIFNAVRSGNFEVFSALAPFLENPSGLKWNGTTLIHSAACGGHLEIIKFLVPLTKSPNSPNSHGVTPICTAATCGHLEIVKYLTSFDKNPNALTNLGATPLYLAAGKGHEEIVKYLVSFDKNPNAPSTFGPTPIYIAAKHGHVNVIKVLAPLVEYPNDSCTDYDGTVYTPIQIAEKYGHVQIVEILQSYIKS